jgi:hypothetical protein
VHSPARGCQTSPIAMGQMPPPGFHMHMGYIRILGHDEEDVATCPVSDGRSVWGSACAGGKARKTAKQVFKVRGNACPVHSTSKNLFQNVMA